MAGKRPERFYLEVLTGEGEGSTCWVNPGKPVLLGIGNRAGLVVDGPGVKAEHAVVSIIKGHVWLENLSSSGTTLNGRLLHNRSVMVADEVIGLGDEAKIALRSTDVKASKLAPSMVLPLLLMILLGGGVLLAIIAAQPTRVVRKKRPVTAAQWQNAYQRIDAKLRAWVEQERLPRRFAEEFTQAWYRDLGGDETGAADSWKRLYNGLVGLRIPGATPLEVSVAGSAESKPDSLYILMGRDPSRDPDNSLLWKGDDQAFASAWWWFVNKRIDELKKNPKS